jgi:hypothetical protein
VFKKPKRFAAQQRGESYTSAANPPKAIVLSTPALQKPPPLDLQVAQSVMQDKFVNPTASMRMTHA